MGCLLGIYNRTSEATLSGGSWVASLPLNNLKTRILGQVARTTNAAESSSVINMDLGKIRGIRVVSLVNHNISLLGTYRVRGGVDAAVSDYDSGILQVWPPVYGEDELEWEEDNWWLGTYTDEEISGYTTNICHILPATNFYRYWRIEIFDSLNAAGYIQLGRVFLGSAWEPERDAEVGLMSGWETNTQVQQALSGTKYFQRRTPYRVTKFSLNVMGVDEAMGKAFEIDRRLGIDGEVLWIQDTADTLHALRRRYLGTLRELTPVEYPYANILRKAYAIEELI